MVEIAKKVDIVRNERIGSIQKKTGNLWYATGEIKLKDGRVLKGESGWPKGFVGNPMTREERLDKFYGQALIVQTREKAEFGLERFLELRLKAIREFVEMRRSDTLKQAIEEGLDFSF